MTFPATIALAYPLPTITESLAIAGLGPHKLTINGDDPAVFNTSKIFDINTCSKAREGCDISRLTLDCSLYGIMWAYCAGFAQPEIPWTNSR